MRLRNELVSKYKYFCNYGLPGARLYRGKQQDILASTKNTHFKAYQCTSIQSNANLVRQTTHGLQAETGAYLNKENQARPNPCVYAKRILGRMYVRHSRTAGDGAMMTL